MSANRLAVSRHTIGERRDEVRQLAGSGVFRRLEARQLTPPRRKPSTRGITNVVLLLVEVSAVVAVALVLVRSVRQWQSLLPKPRGYSRMADPSAPGAPADAENRTADFPRTGTLPGAHEAPLDGGIPQRLRGLVSPLPALAVPTSVPGSPSRIVIAKIGVDAPVVEGDGEEELKMGVGHRLGTANPGERGNMVFSGHNDVYGEVFRDLDRLDVGDTVVVYSGLEPFEYVVRQKNIVGPADLSVLEPSQVPTVTLVSCYPYLVDTHRIVVVAGLVD